MSEVEAYTDYPFEHLGDKPYCTAPIRKIVLISYDGDKYCTIGLNGGVFQVKAGYIYRNPLLKKFPISELRKLKL